MEYSILLDVTDAPTRGRFDAALFGLKPVGSAPTSIAADADGHRLCLYTADEG